MTMSKYLDTQFEVKVTATWQQRGSNVAATWQQRGSQADVLEKRLKICLRRRMVGVMRR